MFHAAIGGLGLLGLVTEIELQLVPVPSGQVRVATAGTPPSMAGGSSARPSSSQVT